MLAFLWKPEKAYCQRILVFCLTLCDGCVGVSLNRQLRIFGWVVNGNNLTEGTGHNS